MIARLDPRDGVELVRVTDEDEYFPPPRNLRELQSGDRGRRHGDARRRARRPRRAMDDRRLSASDVLARCRVAMRRPQLEPGQLRGHLAPGTSRSTRTSPGRPSTRSPRMLFITSVVPPSIELARLRRNAFCSVSELIAVSGRTIS